jgi:hypothetical protein
MGLAGEGHMQNSKTLIIIIDALGHDIVEHLCLGAGLHERTIRMSPSYGFGEAAVMWSGRLPDETNRWNEFTYDPERSPFKWTRHFHLGILDRLADRFVRCEYLEFVVKRIIERGYNRLASHPLPNSYLIPLSKLRFVLPVPDWKTYQLDRIAGEPSVFGLLKEYGFTYSYEGYPERTCDREVYESSMRMMHSNDVTISFFFELDAILHWHGKDSPEAMRKLNELGGYINGLIEEHQRRYANGKIIVFSDHGMSKVEKTLDVRGIIKALDHLTDTKDYLAFYDATMARFWFFREGVRSTVEGALQEVGGGRVLSEEERAIGGINFADRRFGDLIFFADDGVLISPNYFQGRHLFKGVHGHCPPSADQDGFFATNSTAVDVGDSLHMHDLRKVLLRIIGEGKKIQ